MAEKIVLGNRVKDKVSDFEGIATTRLEYIDGKIEFGVMPRANKHNEYPKSVYLPSNQLQKVDDGVHVERVKPVLGFHSRPAE